MVPARAPAHPSALAVPFGHVPLLVAKEAEHEAVAPPFDPAHDQLHGPVPLRLDAVPVEQRLVVGTVETVVPLVDPHAPFTSVGCVVAVVFAEAAGTLPAASKG